MKRVLFILAAFLFSNTLLAEHITGGEMYYRFNGMSVRGEYKYIITLKLYRDCQSAGSQLDADAAIGIFNKTGNTLLRTRSVPRSRIETLQLSSPGPCITNPPVVCYQVGYYEFEDSLPGSPAGYIIAYQRCCRINGINNLVNSGNAGATYTAEIPGTATSASGPQNHSAKFIGKDTVIVCGGYPFTYSFAAEDADPNDQLRYSFCSAYLGGNSSPTGAAPNPPLAPPYSNVSYSAGFSGNSPLGPNVRIDPFTGIISGTSPRQGIYVVTVCVSEIRNGVLIATQRKDLQIKAGGCDIAKPVLKPEYVTCDGLSFGFTQPSNPVITSFYWEFGDPATGVNNISSLQNPTHIFSAPGDYTIKLVTNRFGDCSDSATAIVKVWPGFFVDFNAAGICVSNPIPFRDATTTIYGVVDSWSWEFGDNAVTNDVSTVQNPSWKYSIPGTKTVRLIATNSKGCRDTIDKQIDIIDKPPIALAFRDTLICVPDAVQMHASGTGNFTWTPLTSIINENTSDPTVNPTSTTVYHVQLDNQGCINTDSVRIRVVHFVTLNEMNDTLICRTDQIPLRVESDGLRYQWTPAADLNNPTLKIPTAIHGNSNTYTVTATIGSCSATKDIVVTAVPYPVVNAGRDTIICYNTPAFLQGVHDGNEFTWSPVSSLINPATLNPVAYPAGSTAYILSSRFNTPGTCPKPSRDTVLVTLLPKIIPYAGNDTMVIVGQPLQLNAEGGVRYVWSPPTGLNNSNIKNPVGMYGSEIDSVRYYVEVYNQVGCYDSATIKVTVFKTQPYVFVPSAFSPNGDGLNDVIRPIAVGIQQIKYFRVFNRWGQMVFNTTTNGKGWDGRIGGSLQTSNVYVWMVSAVDYTGKPLFLKGTFTLIR